MPKHLTNIQILRAIAALNVVVFHSIEASKSYAMPTRFFRFMDGWGLNGVDLFFVISGFIMVYIQKLKNRGAIDFIKDRIFRIVPTYWFLTVLMAVLLLIVPSMFRQMTFSIEWFFSSLFFVSGFLQNKTPILYLGWTIEYEMLFYLLFALSFFLKSLSKTVVTTIIALFIFVFLLQSNTILFEFAFGMAIGWWFINGQTSLGVSWASFVAGVIAFFMSLLLKDSGMDRVLIYGLPSAFIVFGLVGMPQVGGGVLSKLGDASYSIYLVQVFTIPVFYKCVKALQLPDGYFDLVAFSCISVSALVGWVFYRSVELWFSKNTKALLA